LNPRDRAWVNIPGVGYAGVGTVTGGAVSAAEFKIGTYESEKPTLEVLTLGSYQHDYEADPERCEWFVPIDWTKSVSVENAVQEIGFFGNQNSVCKPSTPKWRTTVERLKERFAIGE
jgi:hypothetical protein